MSSGRFVNPLRYTNDWLSDEDPKIATVSRKRLVEWLSARDDYDPLTVDLIADCMIAAGIGNEAEQQETVYCTATRLDR